MSSIAAVVLDLDDTLFDHTGSARAGLEAWLATRGVELTEAMVRVWFAAEASHHRDWTDGLVGFVEHRRRRLREVLPEVGLPVGDDDALDVTFEQYLRCYQDAWRGFDDVAPALADLRGRGLATAVLTNGTQAQQLAKVESIGLSEVVGPLFTAEGLGVAKPSPHAFALVCEALGVKPGGVVHVGDNYALDVVAARAAGLVAVHLDRTGAGPLDEVERITTLADLPDHLDRLEQ